MGSPLRLHHDLYRAAKVLTDPGNGKTIRPNRDLLICEMTSGASGETRTLANPTKAGIRFVLRLLTDGGGDVVITAANGLNVALETSATFADAGDMLSLISVHKTATTYRWQVLDGRLGAGIATSTATASATATSSASSTSTPSATTSVSKSTSASATMTVTSTGSGTKTNSPTGTTTRTATDTQTATSTQTQTTTASSSSTSSTSATSTATGTQ